MTIFETRNSPSNFQTLGDLSPETILQLRIMLYGRLSFIQSTTGLEASEKERQT